MLRRRRRRLSTDAGSGNATVLMNLSLFIMLLAFFIVLNAISSFVENKTYPVVESIQMTFSTDAIRPQEAPSVAQDEKDSIRQGETIERIDALFQSQITAFDAVKNDRLGTMEVELPVEVFANAVMAIGQQDILKTRPGTQIKGKKFFLPTLVSIMKSDEQNVPYRMDMIMHVKDNPAQLQNRDPQRMGQILSRGTQWALQLEKNGLAQKLMSVGVDKGDESKVTLVFRPHEPFTPVDPEGTPAP